MVWPGGGVEIPAPRVGMWSKTWPHTVRVRVREHHALWPQCLTQGGRREVIRLKQVLKRLRGRWELLHLRSRSGSDKREIYVGVWWDCVTAGGRG